MKKALLIVFIALVGMTMQVEAQQKVQVPFFKEFLKVKEGTAFRKAPNASSEKLVVEEDFGERWLDWSKTGESFYIPYVALNAEDGDWYSVYVSDEWTGSENAYVPKSAVTKVETKALISPVPNPSQFIQITSGKYKNWYIQFLEEGMDTHPRLAFGVPIGDEVLMIRQIRIYNSGGSTTKLEAETDSNFKEQYGDWALNFTNELGSTFEFNLDKLASNEQLLDTILSKVINFKEYYAIIFCVAGDNDWHYLPINMEKYKGQLFNLN